MTRLSTFAAAALAALCALSLSRPALAHCRLDAPNGGEVLQAGGTATVRWTELVAHGVVNWDLYYSTTGAAGPWLPLALDLPATARSYTWRVPNAVAAFSNRVRVKVVQDMLSFTYEDVSDADLAIAPSLNGDTATLSLAKGGTQNLSVEAGTALAGKAYLVLGSSSGTAPGFSFGGAPVPLNVDGYFNGLLASPNSPPLQASFGVLDAGGRATAHFVLPPGLPAALKGLTLHHAAVVTSGAAVALASNPVALILQS